MKKNKTACPKFLIFTFIFLFLTANLKGQIRIKFSTGLNYLSLNEANENLLAWRKALELSTAAAKNWNTTGGKSKELHNAFEFEGELLAEVFPFLSIGLSSGYIHAESGENDNWITINRILGEYKYIRPTKASGIPLTINLYTHFPITSKLKLFLRGGGGYLWAKYIEQNGQKLISADKFNYPDSFHTSGGSTLIHGGLGIWLKLKTNLNLVIEAQVRRAKIEGFSGENKAGDEGILYFLEEYQTDSGFWQSKYVLSEENPQGEYIRSVRNAVVDFSGVSLKIGIMINF